MLWCFGMVKRQRIQDMRRAGQIDMVGAARQDRVSCERRFSRFGDFRSDGTRHYAFIHHEYSNSFKPTR